VRRTDNGGATTGVTTVRFAKFRSALPGGQPPGSAR
jgi:hypothetical protein